MGADRAPDLIRVVMVLGAGVALWLYRQEFQDAINRFNGRGPRPPSHPLPVEKKLGQADKTQPPSSADLS